jgi:hypothetical protein
MDSQTRHDFTKSHVPPRNQIARSKFAVGEIGHAIMLGKFAQEAVAALFRFSKSTSDPQVAAALIDKAAEIKDRADHPSPDKSPWTPDVDQET